MINKEKYVEFCKTEKDLPIFNKDWWLDSVCGKENWSVAIYEKGGQIWGVLPYSIRERLGIKLLIMPPLTQTLGVYIKYPQNQKYYKKLSWEKEIVNGLVEQLPKAGDFNQNFNFKFTNWLPFYWKGYDQITRYTYILSKDIEPDTLESGFETDIRRRRRKAVKSGVKVVETDEIKKFYDLNNKTFERKNITIPYSYEFVKNLYNNCKKNDAVQVYLAEFNGEAIAGIFLVIDDNTVYYLMGGIDPKHKSLGGMDLLQHHSIQFALENHKNFDFEGSMIESVEKYFRSFGAIQTPYFNISKTNSKVIKAVRALRLLR